MATAKNWKQLENLIQKQITSVLQKEVVEEVKRVMTEDGGVIDKEVYDKYTPYSTDGRTPYYQRTYELKNPNNIISNMVSDNIVAIRSDRTEGGRNIYEVIEYGKGYTWGYTRNLDEEIGARPFHEKTKDELIRSGRHIEAMKRGLRSRGLDVL